MSQNFDAELESTEPRPTPSLWQENHGNWLLAFVALVLAVGAAILVYRQTRFVPVRFPDGSAIEAPEAGEQPLVANGGETMALVVTGSVNDLGRLRVAFYETEESFNVLEQSFLRLSSEIVDGEARLLIPYELVPEKFAVAAYHDENGDGILNRNRFGIPIERYGFSREARGLMGPPSYQEALDDRPAVGGQMILSIR